MKKYIFILLSFGLFSLPLGVFAQATAENCASSRGNECPAGCFNERASSEEMCDVCGEGTYSDDGIHCKACSKPENAVFLESTNGLYSGMTEHQECPWEVSVCDEDMYINNLTWRDWKDKTELTKKLCSSCATGQYADDTTQTWENYSLSNPCKTKTYKIHARIIFPEDCGNYKTGNPTYTFEYKADIYIYTKFLDIIDATKSGVDQTKYLYPTSGTKFDLSPIGYSGEIVTLVLNGDYLTFDKLSQDFEDIADYPNGQEFNMDITLLEKNHTYIYYCTSQFENAGTSLEKCSERIQYDKCDKPTAPNLSDNSIFGNLGLPNCSKGQYADSWKLLHPANSLGSIDWTASNNKVINFGDTIELPTDTDYKFFYIAPNFKDCQSGTYNNKVKCPTECSPCAAGTFSEPGASECSPCPAGTFSASSGASKCEDCAAGKFSAEGSTICSDCPKGFTTASGVAASKTDCYINTTMTFKDNNYKDGDAIKILSSDVYLQ